MTLSGARFLASWAAEEQVLEASSRCPASTWLWMRPLGRGGGVRSHTHTSQSGNETTGVLCNTVEAKWRGR